MTMISMATAYATRLGWPVFPLHWVEGGVCSCGQHDCDRKGKHPLTDKGLHDASKDLDRIRQWWGKWPTANIGVPTGQDSGIDVLDIDLMRGGEDSLEVAGEVPETVESLTGGGGRHLLFGHVEGVRNRVDVLPGVDVRGEGGYVVVPRSRHASGRTYEWEVDHRPSLTLVAAWPPWLLKLVLNHRPVEAPPSTPQKVVQGSRNATLTSIAGALRRRGFNAREIEALLAVANQERCQPPLDDREISGIAASVSRYTPVAPIAPVEGLELLDHRQLAERYNDHVERLRDRRVVFGLPAVDEATRCVAPGEVAVVMASSGVGKTILAQNIVRKNAEIGQVCSLFVSLEQPASMVYERYAQMATDLSGREIEARWEFDKTDISQTVARMLTDRSLTCEQGLDMAGIRKATTQARTRLGRLDLVLVDYLGLVQCGGGKSAYERVSEVSKDMKRVAREQLVAMIVLCQVSRQDGEEGNRPLPRTAGRDSGVTREAADIVLGIYRPWLDMVGEDGTEIDNVFAVQILKNRKGAEGQTYDYRWSRRSLRLWGKGDLVRDPEHRDQPTGPQDIEKRAVWIPGEGSDGD